MSVAVATLKSVNGIVQMCVDAFCVGSPAQTFHCPAGVARETDPSRIGRGTMPFFAGNAGYALTVVSVYVPTPVRASVKYALVGSPNTMSGVPTPCGANVRSCCTAFLKNVRARDVVGDWNGTVGAGMVGSSQKCGRLLSE